MSLQFHSRAFQPGEAIPKKYTCDGQDISPPLQWSGAPAETQTLAMIMDDPDAPAGTWVHWVLYDLPATLSELGEGVAKQERLPIGGFQGKNSFGKIGYGGPCPPPGPAHRYFFKLYALKAKLGLPAGATKAEVESTMQGKIIAQGEFVGRYERGARAAAR
jgi:Raf kinase inhibitor-like YbhB/YbcL family protein